MEAKFMWFLEKLVLAKYAWLFLTRGGARANEYLRFAEQELAKIRQSQS